MNYIFSSALHDAYLKIINTYYYTVYEGTIDDASEMGFSRNNNIYHGLSTSELRDETVCKFIKIRISSQLKFDDHGA